MVKTKQKSLLVTMLVVLFSAILLVAGLTVGNSKPQVDAKVKAETSTTLVRNWKGNFDNLSGTFIKLIVTTDDNKKPNSYLSMYDVSEAQDGSLHAYAVAVENNTYDCIIYGDVDVIYAPEDSTSLFAGYQSSLFFVESIIIENLDTSNVTNMTDMFNGCSKLTTLDISTFKISSSTNVSFNWSSSKSTLKYLYAPEECGVTINLPGYTGSYLTMYEEGTDTAFTTLSSATNGKVLCSEPNTYAPVRDTDSSEVPSTGFEMTDFVLTTTLGFAAMIAVAVVFVNTKKKYSKK